MDWFRTDVGVTRHRDFLRVRTSLKLTRKDLAGHLLCLFEAVAEHEEEGDLSSTPDEVIEEWAEWPQDRAGEFAAAMKSCGWICAGEFAGWYERHRWLFEDRARQAKYRKGKKRNDNGKKNVRVASAERPGTVQVRNGERTRLQDRTGQDITSHLKDEKIVVATAPTTEAHNKANDLFETSNDATVEPAKKPHAVVIEAIHRCHLSKTGVKPKIGASVAKLAKEWLAAESAEVLVKCVEAYYAEAKEPTPTAALSHHAIERLRPRFHTAPASEPDDTYERRAKALGAAFLAKAGPAPGRCKIPPLFQDRVIAFAASYDGSTISLKTETGGLKYLTLDIVRAMDAEKILDADIPAWVERNVVPVSA